MFLSKNMSFSPKSDSQGKLPEIFDSRDSLCEYSEVRMNSSDEDLPSQEVQQELVGTDSQNKLPEVNSSGSLYKSELQDQYPIPELKIGKIHGPSGKNMEPGMTIHSRRAFLMKNIPNLQRYFTTSNLKYYVLSEGVAYTHITHGTYIKSDGSIFGNKIFVK